MSKETTYLTGPLDEEGYVDYQTALNDRMAEGVTAENNALVLIWQAIGPLPEGQTRMPPEYFQRLGIEEPPENGHYFLAFNPFLRKHANLDPVEINNVAERERQATRRPWKAENHPHTTAWLRANEKPLAIVIEATRRSRYYNPLISPDKPSILLTAPLASVQSCREFANALVARALLKVAEGDLDSAWQDLLACLRLARLVGTGATVIEHLVGMAIEHLALQAVPAYLESANLSAKQVQEHLKDLQALPPLAPLADKVEIGERFLYLQFVQLVRRLGFSYMETLSGGPRKKPSTLEMMAIALIDLDQVMREGNQWYDRVVAALRIEEPLARQQAIQELDKELQAIGTKARAGIGFGGPGLTFSQISISLLTPGVLKVQTAADKLEQSRRNVVIAFALAAYRSEHGRYPQKLEELTPTYLPSVPNDLFSDRPLIYRPANDGYLLYSVGPNQKDDEGRGPEDDPHGDDLAVRMPLPKPEPDKDPALDR